MSIEHILGYIGWLGRDAMNNPTALAKAPNELKQIEHNMCGRLVPVDIIHSKRNYCLMTGNWRGNYQYKTVVYRKLAASYFIKKNKREVQTK